ncbi:MAG: hypothetical protein KGQ41_05865 [Alphaproteobacteria bacterium]|nr:hypothetical protein [Alphaproteobacteria bacterium]
MMSSKILPADVLSNVLGLPIVSNCTAEGSPFERAAKLMERRRKHATRTRVIAYRYDGDGRGREMCDKVQAGLTGGDLPFHDICAKLDADVQLIELGAGTPTPEDNARAAAFGMMVAEEDTGLIAVTAFGAEPSARKSTPDFFESTMPDTAALFGAMVSGARAGIPVIAEGLKAMEAAMALYALRPDLCAYVFICGVPTSMNDPRFAIFADDQADHPLYAAAALATLFIEQSKKPAAS